MTILLFFLPFFAAHAEPLDTPNSGDPSVLVGPALIEPQLPFDPALTAALGNRDHAKAVTALNAMSTSDLSGRRIADHAFLLAWSLIRDDRAAEAVDLLPKVEQAREPPLAYRLLTEGELLLAAGKPLEAAERLSRIPMDAVIAPRAWLQAAEAWHEAGATRKAASVYLQMSQRVDPAEGSHIALMALAQRSGLESPSAQPLLRRLWMYYPLTDEGRAAAAALKTTKSEPTVKQRAIRAERLMHLGAYRAAITTFEGHASSLSLDTAIGCTARYAHGRSLYKRNDVTRATQILIPVGESCVDLAPEVGAPALYLAGKGLERRKKWAEAARVYQRIPVLYPDHSMADDGYTLAGIAWQEVGAPQQALKLWAKQVDAYPEGDMAGEGFWRLAWAHYLAGRTDEAIDWAEQMVRNVPLSVDPIHVTAGKYWSARWRIYPDVAHPTATGPSDEAISAGIDGLAALCEDHPTSFYALLAANRLAEIAPEVLETLPALAPADPAPTWSVRLDFLEHPATRRALALARLRLVEEALAELGLLGTALTPSETTIVTDIRALANRFHAHDKLHKYLIHHPPSTLGPDRDRILTQAHPDMFWAEVQAVTTAYDFDSRIFHALVREESSFNPRARSWAGARGLSQLMPATAQQVAGWLKMRVTTAQLSDPKTNLRIGSRYLSYLFGLFNDNPFLAVAGYNAGQGNVLKWVSRFGDVPTDEFVERIPFRETRNYVKRVLGTYQMYRVVYDPYPMFPDWQHTNHRVRATSG
jgi:soluble lytic murein transglycosylase